jgi:sugar lactone lactonase YvrE
MHKTLVIALSAVAILAIATETPSARETLGGMRQRLRSAHEKKDYPQMRQAASDIHKFLHHSPNSTYDLACAAALMGDKDVAIQLLTKAVAARQTFPLEKDDDLVSLRSDPRFQALLPAMKRHLEPLSNSTRVTTVAEKALLPEDIAYDSISDSFFLSSVLTRKIVRFDRRHPEKLTVFADLSSSPGWPLFALALDSNHSVLWTTAAAIPDFAATSKTDSGKTALIKLDLKTGRELARYSPKEDQQPRALGDMTVLADGTVIVSDGLRGGVYRLRPGAAQLEDISSGQFISPQTPAATPDGKYVFVADYTRGIGRINLHSQQVLWLRSEDSVSTNGIDGLYLNGSSLYAVQNGSSPERIVRYLLDSSMEQIKKMEILESNSPGLGDPTHGVFIGQDFYFIANSGWDKLDDHGKLKPGAEFTAPEIRRFVASPHNEHIQ